MMKTLVFAFIIYKALYFWDLNSEYSDGKEYWYGPIGYDLPVAYVNLVHKALPELNGNPHGNVFRVSL